MKRFTIAAIFVALTCCFLNDVSARGPIRRWLANRRACQSQSVYRPVCRPVQCQQVQYATARPSAVVTQQPTAPPSVFIPPAIQEPFIGDTVPEAWMQERMQPADVVEPFKMQSPEASDDTGEVEIIEPFEPEVLEPFQSISWEPVVEQVIVNLLQETNRLLAELVNAGKPQPEVGEPKQANTVASGSAKTQESSKRHTEDTTIKFYVSDRGGYQYYVVEEGSDEPWVALFGTSPSRERDRQNAHDLCDKLNRMYFGLQVLSLPIRELSFSMAAYFEENEPTGFQDLNGVFWRIMTDENGIRCRVKTA